MTVAEETDSGRLSAKPETQIYISKGGRRYGPYALEELRRELEAEIFTPDDFASIDECQTWQPIAALPWIGSSVCRVEVDPGRNLLVIRHRGEVRRSDLECSLKEIKRSLTNIRPDFRLLVDLSELKWMDRGCAAPLRQIMQLCNAKGVGAIVRVIPRPECDIGLGIMSYFQYSPQVQITSCRTLEEAEELLERD